MGQGLKQVDPRSGNSLFKSSFCVELPYELTLAEAQESSGLDQGEASEMPWAPRLRRCLLSGACHAPLRPRG